MRWPTLANFLGAYPDIAYRSFPGYTRTQINQCLTWAIGSDWKDLTVDRLPDRLKEHLDLDSDPVELFTKLREKWDKHVLDAIVAAEKARIAGAH